MNLTVGIVGLPNVGKSTLFNALLQKQQALAANYPFATIEPNVGVVELSDKRLEKLAEVIGNQPPLVRAVVNFVDIAGLVKGASEGEGLGNQFLANIRETDAICHVLRDFSDENVIRSGAVDPGEDLAVIRTELMLADLATLEKQREPKGAAPKEQVIRWDGIVKLREGLAAGVRAARVDLSDDERQLTRDLFLLSSKPELFVINVDEGDLGQVEEIREKFVEKLNGNTLSSSSLLRERIFSTQVVVMCAKTEAELVALDGDEKREYVEAMGISESGIDQLARAGYATLGLMSFLTAGEKECRAWTVRQGASAVEAAGVIHTDFMAKFIKAKVCAYDDFVTLGGWKGAAEKGKVRLEGKDYVMKDGNVVEFMIGT